MSATRMFSPVPLKDAGQLVLADDQARYLLRALRLRRGDQFTMFDGHGGEYGAIITTAGKNDVTVEIGSFVDRECESPLSIHLVQCVSRGDRMDTVVQKATELGVRRITPAVSDFSVVRLDDKRSLRRLDHWRKIAQSACEQCGRNRVPVIDPPMPLLDWFGSGAGKGGLVLRPDADLPLAAAVIEAGRVLFLIGPEGGLSGAEYERAAAANMIGVALGPRVLRTETAAVAVLSVAQSVWGDFAVG